MIDLNQKITRVRGGSFDRWGNQTTLSETEFPARVDELTERIRDAQGNEVVSTMSVLLDGLADVNYKDKIRFTNELGLTIEKTPQLIQPIRDEDGYVILTRVRL